MFIAMQQCQATCIWPARALLGENALWLPLEQRLCWLDIKRQRVLSCDTAGGTRREASLPYLTTPLVPRRKGGFVAGARGGLVACDPATGQLQPLVPLEPERIGNRFNDGKADKSGRLWIGSMDDAEKSPTGALYRVMPDLSWERADDGYIVTNGPAIAPDGRTLYHTESTTRTIYAFNLTQAGRIERKRVFLRFTESEGYPDGMTCDADGRLWVAHWGGGRVTCRDAAGSVAATIDLPTPYVTSCCFGGEDYATLFITTAAIGLTPEASAKDPVAGGLFVAKPGVTGLPPDLFAG